MEKTWKEIQISNCKKIGNKYKQLKSFMFLVVIFIIVADRIGIYFIKNRKRLLGVCISFLIFLVSNSFSNPVFPSQASTTLEQLGEDAEEGFEVSKEENYSNQNVSELTQEILENGEKQYSVDEILNGNKQSFMQNSFFETENGFSKEDWNLILVNKQHPVPDDYSFELGTIAGSMKCDARILPELFAMLEAARDDGVYLAVCSPYRDISRQEMLFNRKIKMHMGNGYSYLEAYKKASQIVTVPGASEHQIGLALDIISDDYTSLDEGFENTAAGKWLKEHSKEYGFILRYPKGKEYITGIDYEPWHFRYVGKDAAMIIMDQGITLEEFVENISE